MEELLLNLEEKMDKALAALDRDYSAIRAGRANPKVLDKITVDLAAHYDNKGKWRDHGALFKIKQEDLHLLLGTPIEYNLEKRVNKN